VLVRGVGRRSTATRLNVKKVRRVSLVDCKAKCAGSEINAHFVIIRKCSAHGAYSAPSAVYELSWPVNFRWLYVEDLFMSQSKTTLAGEQTSRNSTAPVKNIVDTVTDADQFTTLAAGFKAAGLSDTFS
jgi:hypothetical protein